MLASTDNTKKIEFDFFVFYVDASFAGEWPHSYKSFALV